MQARIFCIIKTRLDLFLFLNNTVQIITFICLPSPKAFIRKKQGERGKNKVDANKVVDQKKKKGCEQG